MFCRYFGLEKYKPGNHHKMSSPGPCHSSFLDKMAKIETQLANCRDRRKAAIMEVSQIMRGGIQ